MISLYVYVIIILIIRNTRQDVTLVTLLNFILYCFDPSKYEFRKILSC